MWPHLEDDHMEYGDTGWVSVGEGWMENQANGHRLSPEGVEYDEDGNEIKEAM